MSRPHPAFGLFFAFSSALALSWAQGCKDDGACSVDDGSGCADGMECAQGVDGEAVCVCSIDEQTGCGEGQACYQVEDGDPVCGCSVDAQTGCDEEGLACEYVEGEGAGCFPPVTVSGMVFDLATEDPIEGALVVARDANNAAVSGVAETDADGNYTLQVPTPRTPDGDLLPNDVTLWADAAGYLPFPKTPRVPIPIDTSMATGDPLNVDTAATDVALIARPDVDGLGTIEGTVLAERPRGTLVVAGGEAEAGGGMSGIADFDGTYTIFDVPASTQTVRGYKVGLQLDSASADVPAGDTVTGVDLGDLGEATAVVSGKVEIVNPGDGSDTSIILVVDETFDPTFASGEAPPGLRLPNVSGEFSIDGVPDGNYAVLAAFENDFLVRDPDTAIAGTDIVHITVSGGDLALDQSFKVTGALDVVSPDGEEVVSGTPSFRWIDDSGEDHYEIVVFDAFGNLVWEKLDVPGWTGDKEVVVPYEGPALEPGLLYQFRGTSIKKGGSPISRTEDLRGVFVYQ
jgi:hypothetical protein